MPEQKFVSINAFSHRGPVIETRHTKLTPPMQLFPTPVFQILGFPETSHMLKYSAARPPYVTTIGERASNYQKRL